QMDLLSHRHQALCHRINNDSTSGVAAKQIRSLLLHGAQGFDVVISHIVDTAQWLLLTVEPYRLQTIERLILSQFACQLEVSQHVAAAWMHAEEWLLRPRWLNRNKAGPLPASFSAAKDYR